MSNKTSSNEFNKALPYATVGAVEGVWKYYKPELAWAGILSSIVAYDLLCEPGGTLSESYKKLPLAVRVGAVAIVGAHLIGIPEQIDPITRLFKAVKHV